jgi:zinc transport system substrate-binding protein
MRGFWMALATFCLTAGPAAAAAPKVVASIKPVHSLVSGVMRGLGAPVLLVSGGGSPHGYSLRPSEARALSEADLVFWIGSGFEAFLVRPLAALAGRRARVIALAEAQGVRLLEARRGGAWDAQEEAAAHDGEVAGHGASGSADLHIWLDPRNAIAIVRAAVTALARADPENASRYRRNGASSIAQIEALDGEIAKTLAPVRERPYVVFHDAYQYFERRYGLHTAGAIAVNPEQPPGARRLSGIRAKIAALGVVCVFTEPQFRPALVDTVIAGSAARSAVLDPLGAALPAGPEAYFALMRGLAASLVGCLSPDG